MIRAVIQSVMILVVVLGAGSLQAATVSGLYSSRSLVPEQMDQPSQAQLKEGLKKVLIKVSGRSTVVNKPAVVDALRQPGNWLQQFSYQSTQTPVSAGDGREVLGQRLLLEFDPVLIDQLLQRSGMRAIGHARPTMMVWLAAQRGASGRDYLAPEDRIYNELAALAASRGVPLEVPLLDLSDQTALEVSDLWGFFRPQIEQASARYQPDAILVGRLVQHVNGGWQTEWLLLRDGQTRSFSPSGSLANQLTAVVNDSSDFLLAAMGPSLFSYVETGMQLEVGNVNGIDDYLQLIEYLEQLPPVEKVRVSGVDSDRVMFRVELQGGVQALDQAVRLNPRMAAMSRLGDQSAEAALIYRWQE